MSFEGFYQKLCKKGHYAEYDVHDANSDRTNCIICGTDYVWTNLVDITNGSFEQDERPGFEGNEIGIEQALGKRFNYSELMLGDYKMYTQ